MANIGSAVLHNITPDRVVFCYRQGDADSLEVAEYYKSVRQLENSHLIALPCSDDQYISLAQYLTDIEEPLTEALSVLEQNATSTGQKQIWCIILGYNVPIAYYTDDPYDPYLDPYHPGELIGIASRLHRLGFEIDNQLANFTYDRKKFQFFDEDDAQQLYITAVINGPTKEASLNLIKRALTVDNLPVVTGKIYVDPYGKKDTTEQLQYQSDILDFVENELSYLGLDSVITEDVRRQDPLVKYFANDAFYFGWFTPHYSKDLFLNQSEKRVFLYNADEDSAATIQSGFDENGSDPWCNLAIQLKNGYAATAGSVDMPGENAYLRPRPFFESLHQGASLGESFLFASPFVDWRIILIGDPLLVVNFPDALPDDQIIGDTSLPNNEVVYRIKEDIEVGIGYGARQSRLLDDIVNKVVSSKNLGEELYLLNGTSLWRNLKNIESQYEIFTRVINAWLTYILNTTGLNLTGWLSSQDEQISELLNDLMKIGLPSGVVSDEFIYPQGYWRHDFTYIHNRQTRENIHFDLQVAVNADFSNLIFTKDTLHDVTGWKYESEPFIFVQLVDDGFPSNFSGRRLRYISQPDEYLTRTEIYYIRWRAKDRFGNLLTDWTSQSMIIKT